MQRGGTRGLGVVSVRELDDDPREHPTTAAGRGAVELAFNGRRHLLDGDREGFRLVRLNYEGAADQIAVTSLGEGATVADLSVYARSDA